MAKSFTLIAAIAVAALLTVPLLARKDDHMSTYKWLPTESAPTDFPVEIVKGDLFFPEGGSIYLPDGRTANKGWGRTGSTHVVGDELKPIPDRLELTWFSFVEDKFWGGSFELPTERLTELFEEGLQSRTTGDQRTWDRIVIGMAPEGHISLWVAAEGIVLEVETFIAEERDIPWESFKGGSSYARDQFIEAMMTESMGLETAKVRQKRGAPAGLYAMFKKQLRWDISISGNGYPTSMWLATFNGEREYHDFSQEELSERGERAVPQSAVIDWKTASGSEFSAKIAFDQEETFSAFKKLLQASDDTLFLDFEISDTNRSIDVSLKTGEFILGLEKASVDVYSK